jgi:phosphatidylserine/phosphatidylglycerophosphate/cardiolipin synthase-like enzyme
MALPDEVVEILAGNVTDVDLSHWTTSQTKAVAGIAHPQQRDRAIWFLTAWRNEAPEVPPALVSAILLTAACSEKAHRKSLSLEPVWTGPDVGVVPVRHTEQALLQVIGSARQRLTVVSYAVYNIPNICKALIKAADEGVSISVILESPDKLEVKSTYDTLAALGSSVVDRCAVYLWPLEKREKDESGKPGILHVKCAVADGRSLFLSSANLTEHAFTRNMELGLLITGGHLPAQVEVHFDRMIHTGILVKAG